MTFQQLLADFLKPVNIYKNEFWMDQEMENFIAEFGQWNGSTLYVNPTGSQLCYYKLPTLYDAVTKMFQAQPKGLKYSALTDEGFIEFSHAIHDFYDINISLIAFRKDDYKCFNTFLLKCMQEERIHKISLIQVSKSLKDFLSNFKQNFAFEEINGSLVWYIK